MPSSDSIAELVRRLRTGDEDAANELLPLVYDQLRALAGSYFRGQPASHTLQPTALVHEVFLRLVKSGGADVRDDHHFFAVAATAMRQILTDHARRRRAVKRGGDLQRISLAGVAAHGDDPLVDILDVDEALTELAERDPRQARIVELRIFGGLTVPEVASVLDVSERTVQSDWRRVKAWLTARLRPA